MKKCFEFSKEIYSKEALIKAAYDFIDEYYIHLDSDDEKYIVQIEAKGEVCSFNENEFINAILIHETRKIVSEKTKNIREMMYARAMASTVIDECESDIVEEFDDNKSSEEILTDWFDEQGDLS